MVHLHNSRFKASHEFNPCPKPCRFYCLVRDVGTCRVFSAIQLAHCAQCRPGIHGHISGQTRTGYTDNGFDWSAGSVDFAGCPGAIAAKYNHRGRRFRSMPPTLIRNTTGNALNNSRNRSAITSHQIDTCTLSFSYVTNVNFAKIG